jgi:hypothetical protein
VVEIDRQQSIRSFCRKPTSHRASSDSAADANQIKFTTETG